MMCHICMYRGNGNKTISDFMKVCTGDVNNRSPGSPYPVHALAPGVFSPDRIFTLQTSAQGSEFDPLDMGSRQIGNIDIEYCALRQCQGFNQLQNFQENFGSTIKIYIGLLAPVSDQGYRYGTLLQKPPLQRRRNCARVEHIIAHIGPVIDPGNDTNRDRTVKPRCS